MDLLKSKKKLKKKKMNATVTSTGPQLLNESKKASDANEESGWPKESDIELLKKIQSVLPKDDVMKYDSRMNTINWESVAFEEHTGEECKNRWNFIQGHLRRYRLLGELVEDAILWTDRRWYNFNKGSKFNQKHPDYPKAPRTSFMLFYQDKRAEILAKNPGMKMVEMAKIAGAMFQALSDKKKQKYIRLAEKAKEQYKLELQKFKAAHPDYVPLKKQRDASGKPANSEIPRVPTPFRLFCEAKMKELVAQGMKKADARTLLKDKYKSLSDKKKLKWIKLALEAEPAYLEKMSQFQEANPEIECKKMSVLNKEEKAVKDRCDGKPGKPPSSGYALFASECERGGVQGKGTKNFDQWKALSDAERQEYRIKAAQMKYDYKMKFVAYLDKLTPEQRQLEIIDNLLASPRGKRTAKSKTTTESSVKKPKLATEVPPATASSSESASDSESSEEETNSSTPLSKSTDKGKKADAVNVSQTSKAGPSSLSQTASKPKPTTKKQSASVAKAPAPSPLKVLKTVNDGSDEDNEEESDSDDEPEAVVDKSNPIPKLAERSDCESDEDESDSDSSDVTAKKPPPIPEIKGNKSSPVKLVKPLEVSDDDTDDDDDDDDDESGIDDETATKKPKPTLQQAKTKKADKNSTLPSKSKVALTPSTSTAAKKSGAAPSNNSKLGPQKGGTQATTALPVWAAPQNLFKNEPPKPPETPSDYYAFEILKDVNLSEDQIKAHWEKVPEKKKKQIVAEHKKKAEEYRQKMEKFIRSLSKEDLKVYQAMKLGRRENDSSEDDSSQSSSESD